MQLEDVINHVSKYGSTWLNKPFMITGFQGDVYLGDTVMSGNTCLLNSYTRVHELQHYPSDGWELLNNQKVMQMNEQRKEELHHFITIEQKYGKHFKRPFNRTPIYYIPSEVFYFSIAYGKVELDFSSFINDVSFGAMLSIMSLPLEIWGVSAEEKCMVVSHPGQHQMHEGTLRIESQYMLEAEEMIADDDDIDRLQLAHETDMAELIRQSQQFIQANTQEV